MEVGGWVVEKVVISGCVLMEGGGDGGRTMKMMREKKSLEKRNRK